MGYRDEQQTAKMTSEELANLLALTEVPSDSRRLAAQAELRLREHTAILAQAASAERSARAAERYTRLTFGLLTCTAIAALAAAAVALLTFFGKTC